MNGKTKPSGIEQAARVKASAFILCVYQNIAAKLNSGLRRHVSTLRSHAHSIIKEV